MVTRSYPGRVVIILWITLASMLFAAMTGTFSGIFSALLNNQVQSIPGLRQNRVAVLEGTIEGHLVYKSGGTPVSKANFSDLVNSITSGEVTLGFINAYALNALTQVDEIPGDITTTLVTNTAVAGFLFANSYGHRFSQPNWQNAFTCLQEQSFIYQVLTDDGQFSISTGSTPHRRIDSFTNTFFTVTECIVAVSIATTALVVIVCTHIIFRCRRDRHSATTEPSIAIAQRTVT
jgi:hypothetical protein